MTSGMNLLTDIDGLSVGHATDLSLGSGVTVVVFDEPPIASGIVLGGAPGGRDTALLDPSMTVSTVDALVLSGGSAFGLDAAGGVQTGLREIGRGLHVGSARVPIVPQAILMDLLNGGGKDWSPHSPCGSTPYRFLGDYAIVVWRTTCRQLGAELLTSDALKKICMPGTDAPISMHNI